MAEDKIYISRMLNDVIGNVGDMSTSMTQLSEAMAEMQTAIASNVEELKKITQNTADALTEITVQAASGTAKKSFPTSVRKFSGQGNYNVESFIGSKYSFSCLASGTMKITRLEIVRYEGSISIDSQAATSGKGVVDYKDKSWTYYMAVRIGEKIYKTVAESTRELIFPVHTGDIIEVGFVVKRTTTGESPTYIEFAAPRYFWNIYYDRVAITPTNAILNIF